MIRQYSGFQYRAHHPLLAYQKCFSPLMIYIMQDIEDIARANKPLSSSARNLSGGWRDAEGVEQVTSRPPRLFAFTLLCKHSACPTSYISYRGRTRFTQDDALYLCLPCSLHNSVFLVSRFRDV